MARREGNRRRSCAGTAIAAVLGLLSWLGPAVRGQGPANDITYTRQVEFRIPFTPATGEPRVTQVQLHYSSDQGRTWRQYAAVPPDRGGFVFRAERDGLFLFIARTVDVTGRATPPVIDSSQQALKVWVDTQPPTVALRPLPPREGAVGVEWEVRDDTLDVNSLRLDYRVAGNPTWLPVNVEPAAAGQRSFNPAVAGAVEVRLTVYDRAGNLGEANTTVQSTGGGTASPDAGTPRAGPQMQLVNSKRINLNYDIKGQGPSGVSVVELWITQDGRNWKKEGEDREAKPPFTVEVPGEGLYGFSLVVLSGVGLGDRPPQLGDPPQVWVEVDLTKPVVQVTGVDVGRGADTGKLTITWTARDKNLRQTPITLSYAEKPDAVTWTPIAANLDNTGRYVWVMPPGVPYQFHVRVEAADRAGNVGAAEHSTIVKVDLAIPKAQILGLEPAVTPAPPRQP